jgi:DUF177 domain-containing protein
MRATPAGLMIHPERISAKPAVWEGAFRPGELERLEDSLAGPDGELRYRITAGLDPRRRRVVSCIIEGFVFLTCQTSLERFRHEVAIDDRLVLVESESELPGIAEESDAEDYLVADEPLDIRDLVEDAVLLALPMVPRKPGLEEARGAADAGTTRPTPFAPLASLKRKK